ncbi:MAG: response regulator [Promethearchaeota archaeon]|nr:MAG: response regulator [Candidatus Lokiarchaeota archaeon]
MSVKRVSGIIKIFIVEDDRSLRLLYEKALNLNGYKVVASAENGVDAVNIFKNISEKPDIILMDHRMPLKNGVEAAKEILEIDSSIKIIFVSADNTIKEEALSKGVISFKDKPFSLQRLFNNIEKAMQIIL